MVRSHGVRLHGHIYPVKQVLAAVIGIDRADFQSMQARSVFRRLGFEVVRAAG
jgi:methylmalonyl-CoA mutase cobalamin-binding subunit